MKGATVLSILTQIHNMLLAILMHYQHSQTRDAWAPVSKMAGQLSTYIFC
jgi:hypothetical protein